MDSRTLRQASAVSLATAAKLTYRAEICRRDSVGQTSSYFDGGEFSPYCVESLIELLRGETRSPYQSLDLKLEIRGNCTSNTLRELAQRFAAIHAPKLHIRISASGNRAVVVTPTMRSPEVTPAGTPKGI